MLRKQLIGARLPGKRTSTPSPAWPAHVAGPSTSPRLPYATRSPLPRLLLVKV